MARRQRRAAEQGSHTTDNLTQQDEADVVESVGAEPDLETGELTADPEKVLEAGGIDAESIRENQRVRDYVGKKRGNVKNVPFNVGDVLTKYDTLLKLLPANSIDIGVKRLSGTQVQYTINSRPRSGMELYEAIKSLHGPHEEADYEVRFIDNNSKEFRGIGRIAMPDMRGSVPQQGQQPMNPFNPYAQPGYAPPPAGYPPGYPPGYVPPSPGYPPPGYPQPAQQAPAAPAQAPQQPQVVVHPPPAPGFDEMLASMRQMAEFMRTMQPQPAPQPTPQPFAPPTPPPPPGGTPDMPSMLAWMRQMHEFMQTLQPAGAPAPAPAPTPNPAMAMMGMMPPITPPAGTMWIPGFGFAPLDRVAQLFGAPPGPGYGPRMGYGPPGPGYGPRMGYGPPGPRHAPQGEPPRAPAPEPQRGPTDQLREALGLVRTVTRMAQEINETIPGVAGGGGYSEPQESLQEDEGPIKIIDTGQAKVLVNRHDGTLRGWETMWANIDKIFKWAGEQGEALRKAHAEKEARQQPPRQLPPGFMEVGPNFQPPPGHVAVVVDPASVPEQGLPPPPEHVPPPIQPRPAWGAPTIPFGQGEGEG